MVADVHFYSGSSIYYPANPVDQTFGCDYYFSGTNIVFTNRNDATRARFMIYAEDLSAPTSGTNKVLRQFTEGGVDVVQFLRPGSDDPPSFSDIIIDTRYPGTQILAEGYISVGTGQLTHEVNLPSGFFPMVKYMTVHGAGSKATFDQDSYTARSRIPFVKRLVMQSNYNTGDSTYCLLTSAKATFYTFKGNMVDYYREQDGNHTFHADYDSSPIVGIRYFIFGIPTP